MKGIQPPYARFVMVLLKDLDKADLLPWSSHLSFKWFGKVMECIDKESKFHIDIIE